MQNSINILSSALISPYRVNSQIMTDNDSTHFQLQNPPTLSYCYHDKQTVPISHYTHVPRSEKYIAYQRGTWQHTDREDGAVYFSYETRSQDPQLLNCVILKEIQTINTVLWIFNVLTCDRSLYCLNSNRVSHSSLKVKLRALLSPPGGWLQYR